MQLACVITVLCKLVRRAQPEVDIQSDIHDRAYLRKYLTAKSCQIFSRKTPSYMFDWVLYPPLHTLLPFQEGFYILKYNVASYQNRFIELSC